MARPTVTFPAARDHLPLAGTKLYCLVTGQQSVSGPLTKTLCPCSRRSTRKKLADLNHLWTEDNTNNNGDSYKRLQNADTPKLTNSVKLHETFARQEHAVAAGSRKPSISNT